MMEPDKLDLLRQVGERLHGVRWQTPLALDLGLSDRALRYWLSGESAIPDDIGDRLTKIVSSRRADLDELTALLDGWKADHQR